MLSVTSTAAAVTVFICRLAIGATGVLWLALGDWLSFCVAFVALLLTIPAARFVQDEKLRNTAAALIALLLAAHIVLGMQMGLYEASTLYDKAMHLIGSGAVAVILIVAAQTYCNRACVELPALLFMLLVFTGTLSVGTLWEIFEFSIDRTGLFVTQRGLQDTMFDLVANALGAVLVLSVFAGTSGFGSTRRHSRPAA